MYSRYTGASGAIYGIRLLEVLRDRADVETHAVISGSAEMTIRYETGRDPVDVAEEADYPL